MLMEGRAVFGLAAFYAALPWLRTAGQREDYLLAALRAYKSGARTGSGVAAMPDAVYPLVDEQLQALAHFLSHLP